MAIRGRLAAGLASALVSGTALGACGGGDGGTSQEPANTLHILAGSELQDVTPLLDDIRAKTGINVVFDFIGTLDGAEQIANGQTGNHALAWFSSASYLSLLPGGAKHVVDQHRIALSPVVLGVKRARAVQLGWENNPNVTWKDVAVAAGAGRFTFGMTNPSASNSGFSALVGVAAAFSGTPNALTLKDINAAELKQFFSGERLTAGSSGFLASTFVSQQSRVDGIINYESVLLGLNAGGKLQEPLDLVYPRDGIITADYPLMLLDASRRDQYQQLLQYFQAPDVQRRLMTDTNRRPAVPGVPLDSRFPAQTLIELPLPAQLTVVDTLIQLYLDVLTRPVHTIYVLDLSGSMDGARLDSLKSAFHLLTDPNATGVARFARLRSRESVTIVTFSDTVEDVRSFTVANGGDAASLKPIADYVDSLQAGGNTAIYSAMDRAYHEAQKQRAKAPDDFYSVVLMTDGENNSGESSDEFLGSVRSLGLTTVPSFPILFGEGVPSELDQIATATGGKVFDSRQVSLGDTFRQIRGYE